MTHLPGHDDEAHATLLLDGSLPVVDLSNTFLTLDDLVRLRAEVLASPPGVLLAESCVVAEKDADGHAAVCAALQDVLEQCAGTLQSLSIARSNVGGRMFYKGYQLRVASPEAAHVSVESVSVWGTQVVRDDDPPLLHSTGPGAAGGAGGAAGDAETRYYYVQTTFDGARGEFWRHYVELDWLARLVEVDVSRSKVTGHGVTSLVAATGSRLRVLRMAQCDGVDDSGLYTLVQLCKSLRVLDISGCGGVSRHGLWYLSEFQPGQVAQFERITIHSILELNNEWNYFVMGLAKELEELGFHGTLHWHPRRELDCKPRDFSLIDQKFQLSPEHIFDLCGRDITKSHLYALPEEDYQEDDDEDYYARRSSPDGDGGNNHNNSSAGLGGDDDGRKPSTSGRKRKEIQYVLNLERCFVNDRLLGMILSRWGSKLYALVINETLVTESGLAYISMCPELRVLSIARCWNVRDKSRANRAIMPAVNGMLHLRELDVSDTRISGRMFSQHPRLRLRVLRASRCPISAHAMRTLAETCTHSLRQLHLSGCDYLNSKSIHFLLRFTRLEVLDLSFCNGLKCEDIMLFQQLPPAAAAHLRVLNVSGIAEMTESLAQELATSLTQNSTSDDSPVSVLLLGPGGVPTTALGRSVSAADPHYPYTNVGSPNVVNVHPQHLLRATTTGSVAFDTAATPGAGGSHGLRHGGIMAYSPMGGRPQSGPASGPGPGRAAALRAPVHVRAASATSASSGSNSGTSPMSGSTPPPWDMYTAIPSLGAPPSSSSPASAPAIPHQLHQVPLKPLPFHAEAYGPLSGSSDQSVSVSKVLFSEDTGSSSERSAEAEAAEVDEEDVPPLEHEYDLVALKPSVVGPHASVASGSDGNGEEHAAGVAEDDDEDGPS